MDQSRLEAFVEKHVRGLMQRLGLPHWTIVFYYDLREDNGLAHKKAECSRQVNYNRAKIDLDPSEFDEDDPEENLRVLRHELFHVVLSPFDLFYNAAEEMWKDDPVKRGMIETVWHHAQEQAVINLERMHSGLTDESKGTHMGRQRSKPPESSGPKPKAKPKAKKTKTAPKG
jgi:hypothetical protein